MFADLVSVLGEGREVHCLTLLVLHHMEVLETAQDQLQQILWDDAEECTVLIDSYN